MKLAVIVNIDSGLYYKLKDYMSENGINTISPDINSFLKDYLKDKEKTKEELE